MCDKSLVIEELQKIEETIVHILGRTENILSANDFVLTPWGVDMLDVACIRLEAIGETLKKLDKHSNGQIFSNYSTIPWKKIMRMRDIVAHHYFEVDFEIVFKIIKEDLRPLLDVIRKMQQDV